MYRLVRAQQDRADGDAIARRHLEQIVGDIRRIQIRHDQQIGLALQARSRECLHAQAFRHRRIAVHLAFHFQLRRQLLQQLARPAHLAAPRHPRDCRNWSATAAPPWASVPKRRTSSAASIVISATCSAVGSRLTCVSQMNSGVVGQHQDVHRRIHACARDAGRSPRRCSADGSAAAPPCRTAWHPPRPCAPASRAISVLRRRISRLAASGVTPLRCMRR